MHYYWERWENADFTRRVEKRGTGIKGVVEVVPLVKASIYKYSQVRLGLDLAKGLL